MYVKGLTACAACLQLVYVNANPLHKDVISPDATPTTNLKQRGSTCTFSGSDGASSVSASKTSCATIVISNVAVPGGTTLDLTNLNDGTEVIFEGETTFGYKEWTGPLVSVSGTDITVTGASGSTLNGDGPAYWDGKGSNGGKTKPTFFDAHNLVNSVIENIEIVNSPVQVFSIDGASGLHVTDVTIDNTAGNGNGAANTDCFDIGQSSNVIISGAHCYNQDDCVAINSGTGITFSGGLCSGGHGLSVGSVGGRSDNTVENVVFENSQIENSQNGCRVKTVYQATGSVKNVTYSGITLSGITNYGVVVEQDYENGSPTGTPTNGVPITELTLDNVQGTVESSGYNVYILCASGACSDWVWTQVDVHGGETDKHCENVPDGASC